MLRASYILGPCVLLLAIACGGDKKDTEAEKGDKTEKAEAEPTEPEAAAEPTADAPKKLTMVDVPDSGELAAVLAAEVKKAEGLGLQPQIEFWADWCGPCKELEASLDDPRMQKAFAGVYLIRMNADFWGDKLDGTGMTTKSIPAFFELDATGKATGRSITGGAWAENIPENMAPPLAEYFAGAKKI